MSDSHDYLALDWVKDEIQETLNQSQQALEAYVENPDDSTRMRFCQTYLHQVYGTLQMVEFYGASLLAEEMEKLAQALLDGKVGQVADAQEVLMRAILQLPPYLDRVQTSRRDLPLVLLPLLNDLRAARGEALMTETALFKPDIESQRTSGKVPEKVAQDQSFPALARKIRQMYQISLLGVIRGEDPEKNLDYMRKVFAKLEQVSGEARRAPLWRISAALVEGVSKGVIEAGTSVKMVLGQVDRALRELAGDGVESLNRPAPKELLKNLLYYIAKAPAETPRIRQIHETYRLADALPSEEMISQERARMTGPDQAAMGSVVDALSEELTTVKDALERFVHNDDQDPAALASQRQTLKQVADTVAVLGMGKPRQLIQEQLEVLEQITEGKRELSRDVLMEIAGALLYVEASLSGAGKEEPREGVEVVPDHVARARSAVIRECRAGLEEAKDGIVEFIASQWDRQHLEEVPARLNAVRGGLEVILLQRPALILRQCVQYINEKLLVEDQPQPDWRTMDTLADAITGVEYFLERLADDPETTDDILDIARKSVNALGYGLEDEEYGRAEDAAEPDPFAAALEPESEPETGPAEFSPAPGEVGIDETEAGSEAAEAEPQASGFEEEEIELSLPQGYEEQGSGESEASAPEVEEPLEPAEEDGDAAAPPEQEIEAVEPEDQASEQIDRAAEEAAEAPASQTAPDAEQPPASEPESAGKGFPIPESWARPEQPPADAFEEDDGLVDDEIIEIFAEEADEVLEALNEYFPRWAANQNDEEALVEFRRAFHTLKGSGRMVGAHTVGELAWSVENMMNRVIDKTIEPAPQLVELVQTVHGLIPEMVKAFSAKQPPPFDVYPLMCAAFTLAEGGSIDAVPDVKGGASAAVEQEQAQPASPQAPEPEAPPEAPREQAGADEAAEEIDYGEMAVPEEEPDLSTEESSRATLLEIFANESETNLAEVRRWLDGLDRDFSHFTMEDYVHRALHTLKGSARMAELEPVARVAEPVEKYVKELINGGHEADRETVAVLEETVRVMSQAVSAPPTDPQAALPGSEQLLERVRSAHENLIPAEQVAGEQESALSIFLGEAMDRIMDAEDQLEQWKTAPADNGEALDDFRRGYRCVRDSAARADLTEITELAAALADTGDALAERRVDLSADARELLTQGHEAIMSMMDFLAAGQTLQPADDLIADLRHLIDGGGPPPGPEGGEAPPDSEPEPQPPEQSTPEPPASDEGGPEAAAEAPAVSPDELDPELVELFLEEAEEILESAGEALDSWEQSGDAEPVQGLQRDLHTLKGGARMAQVQPIGDLSHELENLYEGFNNGQFEAGQGLFDLLHACHDRLADMVDALRGGQPCAAAPDLVQAIERFLADPGQAPSLGAPAPGGEPAAEPGTAAADEMPSSPSAPSEQPQSTEPAAVVEEAAPPPPPERDPELVEIFLEEADEILESATSELESWMEAPDNLNEVQALQRDLHTLKGGARMAEVPELGDLSHELENLYEGLAQKQLSAQPVLFDLLYRCHDRLAEMVEAVKADQGLHSADQLIRAIHDYIADPAAFRLPPLEKKTSAATGEPAPSEPEPEPVQELEQDTLGDDVDADILEIFMEESGELAEVIDAQINAWREDPDNNGYADELKRALHTLKGGARLAGLEKLGNLSHDFEAYLLDSEHSKSPRDRAFFDKLNQWQDQIAARMEMLKQVAAAGAPAQATPSAPAPAAGEEKAKTPEKAAQPPAEKKKTARDDRQKRQAQAQPQEMVRLPAEMLEALVNLAGETSINRGRVEQGISEFVMHVGEMGNTVERLYEQLRRLDVETEAQILSNYQQGVEAGQIEEGFDPLEMDQYSELNQITKQLSESASDLLDLKQTLLDRTRDTETLLLQQSRINTELQEKLMRTRMVPFSRLVPRLRRIVRQASGEVGKRVEFDVLNPEGELDRTLLERVVAPLEHMLRNAVDHGVEDPEGRRQSGKDASGHVTLELSREGGEVLLILRDDGKGIDTDAVRKKAIERGLMDENAELADHEIQQFIFAAGFSTAAKVTQLSGRGVGMDVVASEIKQMGGSVTIDSEKGRGTRFTVRLPFTLAMNRALMVGVGEDAYAIPLDQIEGIVRISPYELEEYVGEGAAPFSYAGQSYDMEYLGSYVHGSPRPRFENQTMPLPLLLIRSSEHAVALLVDDLIGSREVVVKSVGPQLSTVAGINGATILGDGSVVIILDIHSLIRAAQLQRQHEEMERRRLGAPEPEYQEPEEEEKVTQPLVMVTDDSVTVRKVTGRLLERNGYDVITAKDGMDAVAKLEDHQPDLMLLDIEMPRMDGFEVASHVRHDQRLKEVPIIMITSRTGEKHRERAFDIGVNAYMGKPFQEGELLRTIGELIEAARETADQ